MEDVLAVIGDYPWMSVLIAILTIELAARYDQERITPVPEITIEIEIETEIEELPERTMPYAPFGAEGDFALN